MSRSLALLSVVLCACLAGSGCDRDGAPVIDRAEDAVSVPVGQASARVTGGDLTSRYVSSALIGKLYEVETANIALERSNTDAVRMLAQRVRTERARRAQDPGGGGRGGTVPGPARGPPGPETTGPDRQPQKGGLG